MKFPLSVIVAALVSACDSDVPSPVEFGLTIGEVQGSSAASPLAGQFVTVSGVVSGDFQDDDADRASSLGGFYLQSLEADEDPRTSDGLFVFDRGANGPDLVVGDVVSVTGIVAERFGETQIAAEKIERTGRAQATAIDLPLPAAALVDNSDGAQIADLERYEGMLVRVPQTLFVQDLTGLERYGEILLSLTERQYQFTSTNRPDPAAYREHRAQVAARTLMLDDGRAEQNVRPLRYLGGAGLPQRAPRLSDGIGNLQGVLRYSRGSGPHGAETWRLMPTVPPTFELRNPRPARPELQGDVIVASINLLNYFSTPDDGTDRCGPAGSDGCRGADSPAELERQRRRTAAAIRLSGADVIGVMELENNEQAAIEDLRTALAAQGDDWQYVDTGVIGNDAIRVALLYRPARVSTVGDFAILDSRKDPRFNDSRNRPALAQTFRSVASGGVFTLAVNHLKSKGSPCDADGDPNRGDGQGNCNVTRTRAAEALADWLAGDPTGSGDSDRLIIGDLNAYLNEDPLRALEAAGFDNLVRDRLGDRAWSFAYGGESGILDHALSSPSLTTQVTAVLEWHINADEAPVYDYNLDFDRDPALFVADEPWRAADHDPLLIALTLQAD